MPKIADMEGVREYCEGYPVELWRGDAADQFGERRHGRLFILAWNECQNNSTNVDLLDLLKWLSEHPQYAPAPASEEWNAAIDGVCDYLAEMTKHGCIDLAKLKLNARLVHPDEMIARLRALKRQSGEG